MRAASLAAGAAAAALLLLTWLLARGIDVDARPFDRALAALADVELAEGAMDRDVLSARAGLLRDYDPLVREARRMEDALGRLRGPVADAASVDRLAAWLARREPLLEEFKSANAVLQNSLVQFGRISGQLAAPEGAGPASPGAGALASAVLRLSLDTSPEAAREVARELDRLAPRVLLADPTEPGPALLAHGTLLHELLPAADRALRALLAAPSRPEREAVRASVQARRGQAERSARRYRVLLYAASVLLLGLLVHLGLRLRARALALRRRAAFDRTLADVSTGLIGTAAADARAQAERALARIAERVGADRAYLVRAGPPREEYAWSAPGVAFPPAWPAGALALAGRLPPPAREGVIRIVRGGGEPVDVPEDALAAAGARGWIAATRTDAGGNVTALLGCDVVRPGTTVPAAAELGPLRLALDAVANVVERADLERERSRLEARLERSRRMEALGSFAGGIAHNFNNILGAVLGYAEVAEADLASGGRATPAAGAGGGLAANLGEIRRAGERARDLVEQILAFGRGRVAARRPVAARAVVAEAEAILRATLPAGVRLAVGDVPESAVVSADAVQLQQVVVNLCANAAQATDGGGTISIDVEERDVDRAREFAHGELGPGQYAVLSVSDTGRGMDDATLARIFEPFFTTREAGHGLGLATVREVVLGHGGAIDVRSAPGAGTRFEVWLPRAGATEPAPPDVAFGRGETLLLVGGAADRLAGDEELLAALGYEPVGFAAPGEALDAVRAAPGRFDAAVVRHAGPGPAPAALGLVAELRGAAPGLPVVLAAASTEGIGAGAPASRGVAEVVRWPLACDELAPALRRCLAARSGEPAVASWPVAPRP